MSNNINSSQNLSVINRERAQYLGSHIEDFFYTTFCQIFHEAVLTYPEKEAIIGIQGSLTYKELEEKSNCLATYLLENKVKPDEIIGIRADQTVWSVIAMLGIWKAGAAFVFIDRTYPESRQKHVIDECECRFVLEESFLTELDWTKNTDYKNHSRQDSLALLIYTSGSTSKPKGVMIEQRNITAVISNFTRFELTEEDRLAVFPCFSFVASVFDLFSSLAVGASIYLIPSTIRKNVHELYQYYIANNITVTFLPPHMATKFIYMEEGDTNLRLLIVGSETVRNLDSRNFRIINVYASSEMTSLISVYDVKDNRKNYPIGTLNPTVKGYIVDDNGEIVPEGEKGELWLASRQVVRGYFKDEEKTKQHFMVNPFSEEEGYCWLYKTNDLVRKNQEGNLEFICRKDNMFKIRGFRVEAGAVESAMQECAKMTEVVVKAFPDSGGCNILCGYFVAEEQLDQKTIKAYLKKKLPYYMVPTAIFQLKEFPRNMNNKIDRGAILPPKELDNHKLLEELY